MRIGTWNLAGRWSPGHEELLDAQRCDVWLLTEVSDRVALDGFQMQATVERMAQRRHWAAVAASSSDFEPLPDPHPASAAARVDGVVCVSSILPWRSAGRPEFWGGRRHAEKMAATLDCLERSFAREGWSPAQMVWGGDWNQSLTGGEYAGTKAGRGNVLALLHRRRLKALTTHLRHRLDGVTTIDHIAVPEHRAVSELRVVPVELDGRRLSDHDMYVAELA